MRTRKLGTLGTKKKPRRRKKGFGEGGEGFGRLLNHREQGKSRGGGGKRKIRLDRGGAGLRRGQGKLGRLISQALYRREA